MEPPREDAAAQVRFPHFDGNEPYLNGGGYVADVAIINAASGNAGQKVARRLTVSEPPNGYPSQFRNAIFVPNSGLPASRRFPGEEGMYCWGGQPERPSAIDTPLDNADPDLIQAGFKPNFRQVFLQRLANPLLPFHPVTNPYRTVDRHTVNLTVFNGRLRATEEENGVRNTQAREGFSSLERGFRGDEQGDEDAMDVWSVQPLDDVQRLPRDRRRAAINRVTDDLYSIFYVPPATLGFLNRPFMENNTGSHIQKRLQPDDPLAWFTWNNRPYVSGNELLLVPRLRSSQLLTGYTMADADNSFYDTQSVDPDPRRNPMEVADDDDIVPFMHLENFMYVKQASTDPADNQPQHLYRLLDFVGTPSLYSGATTWLNPLMNNNSPAATSLVDPRYNRQPPFNNYSTFREPGKINLNTIASPAVYAGLFHDDNDNASDVEPDANDEVHPGPQWTDDDDSFIRSRRGYDPPPASDPNDEPQNDILALNVAWPTFFANPFRSASAANLVPLPNMVRQDAQGVVAPVECTMLRSKSATANQVDDEPLFVAETEEDHNDAERSPGFFYAPMTRLDNLVTSHSNVYAVWITIGFFEVEEADASEFAENNPNLGSALQPTFARVYPDGYMLGQEDGLDEGNVRRLRGFYVIDRTRPAAFQPGLDNNVENTIRLRRRIE
jgi:hypothetical protein